MGILKENLGALTSLTAGVIAIIAAIFAARKKRDTDVQLEAIKLVLSKNKADYDAAIAERHSETAARREYEFDARKRLYAEYEPLIFRCLDNASNAYYRIQGLARGSRESILQQENYLGSFDYYFKSTIYKLMTPLALFRLMQNKLTMVDLKLDKKISLQYLIIKQIYLLWTDDFVIARLAGLDYDPNNTGWRELRQQDSAKYWRQGLPMGLLDIVISLVTNDEINTAGILSYGDFERKLNEDDYSKKQIALLQDVFLEFNAKDRPVLWLILLIQAILYNGLLRIQAEETPEIYDINWYDRYFRLDEEEMRLFYTLSDQKTAQYKMDRSLEVARSYITHMRDNLNFGINRLKI